jgi:ferritin-like metal-binding protein YciE
VFFPQLAELLWVERTLAFEALPKLIGEARDAELRTALEEHLVQTKEHVARVEEAFRASGAEASAARSPELAAALEQHDEQDVKEPTLRDLFHAAGAVRTEHLELGLYDAVLLLADRDAESLLQQNRKDEEGALKRVVKIAERLASELPS